MSTNHLVTSDYKKWLLYSFDKQSFNAYYDLFKALKSGQTFGSIRIESLDNPDGRSFTVAANGIDEELHLTASQKDQLIKYLVDNYFHTEDIDGAFTEKSRQADKIKNHSYLDSTYDQHNGQREGYKVKPHPKESTYFNIELAVSLLFYAFVLGVFIYGAVAEPAVLIYFLIAVPLVLIILLMRKITHGIFIGIIRGNTIRVTKEQYPDIYKIIEEQAYQLGLKNLPEIYIASGHFNAFATKFSRSHILLIFSEVIETALTGNYDVLKYVTAHELCHIKQKHMTKRKYLLPASLIPFLRLAYSRGCEYTCDRTGYHFSPKGSIEGILIMTTGKEIHSKFNIELHIKNSIENEGLWTWVSEKFLTHPHLYKRLIEIREYSR